MVRPRRTWSGWSGRGWEAADGDRSPLLHRIVAPTRVIHGEADPLSGRLGELAFVEL